MPRSSATFPGEIHALRAASAKPGSLRWVLPLQSIVCTFGAEHDRDEVIPFEIDGIRRLERHLRHRFHAAEAITVRRFADYAEKLEKAKVVIDAERRKEIISARRPQHRFRQRLELVEDEGLLEEVAGLGRMAEGADGSFEESYLEIPSEIIRLTIKTNQKMLRHAQARRRNAVQPVHFVSNIEAKDGGRRSPTATASRACAALRRGAFLEARPVAICRISKR